MSVYFKEPYKNYNETLKQMTDITSESKLMASKISDAITSLDLLSSLISYSNWKEQGTTELTSSTLSTLKENLNTTKDNITNSLSPACDIAINKLYAETELLRVEDINYENIEMQLSSLVQPLKYDSDGYITSSYYNYLDTRDRLNRMLDESIRKCESYQTNCDNYAKEIKEKEDSIEEYNKLVVQDENGNVQILSYDENENLIKISYEGREYYIANTKINALDYEQYLQKYNLTQNGGVLGSMCAILAQYYAMDMMRGTYTTKDDMVNMRKSPSTRLNDTCESTNMDDVLEYIYNETINGRLTTIQATQVMTPVNGGRHVLTVVGFDSSVKSWEDLNPDTILVLDNVDGKIQTLSGYERTDGKGHNRKLYNMRNGKGENTYLAHGATQAFLDLEVTNKEWQAKHGQSNTTA